MEIKGISPSVLRNQFLVCVPLIVLITCINDVVSIFLFLGKYLGCHNAGFGASPKGPQQYKTVRCNLSSCHKISEDLRGSQNTSSVAAICGHFPEPGG